MLYPFSIAGIEGQDLAVEVPGWLGAPRVLVNGQPVQAGRNPREFLITLPDGMALPVRLEFSAMGSMLSVAIGEVKIPLTEPLAWHEWAWNGLPFLLVFGGGAVGGALGGMAAMVNLRLFRSLANPLGRYGLTALVSLAAMVTYLMVAAGIHGLLGKEKAGVASTSGPLPKPALAQVRSFVLPGDWKALHDVCQAEITGEDAHERVALRLGRIPEDVSITIPAGMLMRPILPEAKHGACMTRLPEALSATARDGTKSFALLVVNTEPVRWELPRKADRFEIAGMEANPRVLDFMREAKAQNVHYNLVQTGVWVLMQDITLAQFSKNRLGTNVYDIGLGTFRTTPLADYAGVRKLRPLFEKMKLGPAGFQLFKDQRAEFEKVLQRMDFAQSQTNWDTMLSNGALEAFAGEPETEALLLRYATGHADLSKRESAMKSLMKIGMLGDAPALLQQMLTTGSREHRFLAAHGLVAAGDLRGEPVLAGFAGDPSLGKMLEGLMMTIQKRTKVAPVPGETVLVYWERAGGWETLTKQYGDVKALRVLVEKGAAGDPWLEEYLGKLKGASDQETTTLLRTIESRYQNNARAFAAVREILVTHPSWQVRQSAGRALVDGWKQSPEIRGTVVEVMAKDADHHVVSDFLRHAIVFGKVSPSGELLQAALGHQLPEVRADTMVMLSRDRKSIGEEVVASVLTPEAVSRLAEIDPESRVRLTAIHQCLTAQSPLPREKVEAILLRVAEKEAEKNVRSAALSKLCEAKARTVLPLLQKMLTGSKEEKASAVSLLDVWKNDPESIALLESVRNDPDVGRHAANVLKRLGR
jgi:hypothetical protein